jgi:hypothetical protein
MAKLLSFFSESNKRDYKEYHKDNLRYWKHTTKKLYKQIQYQLNYQPIIIIIIYLFI